MTPTRVLVILAICSSVGISQSQAPLDTFISTGDNHWLGSSLPIDSPRSIEDTFEFLQKVCGVKRVYWRGLEEATWVQTMDERPENCRYYSFWEWIRRLYRDVDPDVLAAQAARKRGMEIWGVGTMFDWGAQADTPGFGDYPANSESRLRLQHPEWAPVDRHGFRRQGGPIELAYPEARKALVDLHANEMRRVGYDGLVFLTYVENYSLRFQDEFGYSPPIAAMFQQRVRKNLLSDPFDRTASREDWLRVRGNFVTDYLRELKTALEPSNKKLGVFVDPHDLRQPQPWNVPETIRTAGAHCFDLETWVRDGLVDLLPVYGYCAPQLQDSALLDARWLTRATGTKVAVVTSSPTADKWAAARAEGVRTILAVSEDQQYLTRGGVPEQTVDALASGDLAKTCKALSQIIEGKLAAPAERLIALAQEGNLIQRRLALQALSLTKDAESVAALEAALDDPENGIRCIAAFGLRQQSGAGSAAAILAAVEKWPTHPLREMAATALMGMKPFPREALQQAVMTSKSEEARLVALRALTPSASPADVPAFVQGLTAAGRYPRFQAVTALGNVRGNDQAVQTLLRALTHFDAVVANRAAASLGEMARRKEAALASHRAEALTKLNQRFAQYTEGYAGIDRDWGYRTVGNALLDFGAEGEELLRKAREDRKDLRHARLAFSVLDLRQRPASFSQVSETENEAAFKNLPPAPAPQPPPVTLVVDPAGDIKTIAAAVKKACPGDTIQLTPGIYKESLVFADRSGEYGKPIIFDGQGSTLDGGDEQDLTKWEKVTGDLYRKAGLLRMDDAILMRWFFVIDGKVRRMNRCSKGHSEPLKAPSDLQENEWTYVKSEDAFYIRAKQDTPVIAPIRSSGVQISGTCRHLIVRNVTATHVYNDGYNIHGWCRDVQFENIKAIECGDDGVSAHDDCQIAVHGLVSRANATGITDVGNSESHYSEVEIADCDGFDLFFIGSNAHSLTNAVIHSRAQRALMLDGSRDHGGRCTLRLENVKLLREGEPDEIRVTANSALTMHRVEAVNLKVQVTGGELRAEDCVFKGEPKPTITLWPGTRWSGDHNVFSISGLRYANQWFYAKDAEAFSKVFGSDSHSKWE